jgi:RNA polymerase sigma factor (sigma-70 family)
MDKEHAIERRRQFESNCEEHRRHVYLLILGKIRNATDAQDLTQETILRFLNIMDKNGWEKEINDVGAYTSEIARNLCNEWFAKHWRETPLEADDEEGKQTLEALEDKAVRENDLTSSIEDEIYNWEIFRGLPLKTILGRLTEDERQLLRMLFVDGLDAEEIANELGRSVERVRYQINKLMAKLRYRGRRLSR